MIVVKVSKLIPCPIKVKQFVSKKKVKQEVRNERFRTQFSKKKLFLIFLFNKNDQVKCLIKKILKSISFRLKLSEV